MTEPKNFKDWRLKSAYDFSYKVKIGAYRQSLEKKKYSFYSSTDIWRMQYYNVHASYACSAC